MARISFTTDDGTPAWFDPSAAKTAVSEGQNWDGNNWRGACSGLQTSRAVLYLTAGGRWIENADARSEFNGSDRYRFLSGDEARAWLMKAADAGRKAEEAAEALAEFFSDMPEESGPNLGGRPVVGPKVETRLPEETIARVDARAAQEGVARAEMLRRLIEAAL